MPSAPYLSRPMPGWVRALLAAMTLCAAAYAVLLVGGGDALGVDPRSWSPVGAFALGAALVCGLRAVATPEERLVWALLGAGIAVEQAGGAVCNRFGPGARHARHDRAAVPRGRGGGRRCRRAEAGVERPRRDDPRGRGQPAGARDRREDFSASTATT
jgi:hypothetical protein